MDSIICSCRNYSIQAKVYFSMPSIEIDMLNGASPQMFNQGLNAGFKKISSKPSFHLLLLLQTTINI